jgi:hypothetical protein
MKQTVYGINSFSLCKTESRNHKQNYIIWKEKRKGKLTWKPKRPLWGCSIWIINGKEKVSMCEDAGEGQHIVVGVYRVSFEDNPLAQ